MTILYCGGLSRGSTCRMRCDALHKLGHKVIAVDTTYDLAGLPGLSVRALRKLGYAVDTPRANEQLRALATRERPELVWIDKGLTISPNTLRVIRASQPTVQIVHYSLDDMSGRHNQSRQYLSSIPLYDLHVTTKSFGVRELYQSGARAVLFVNNAYCTDVHRPIEISLEDKPLFGGVVGFIGAFEKDRANALSFLASQGIPVRIWGGGWGPPSRQQSHVNMVVEGDCLWGEEYVKAICSFEINLGFLRKLNRDLQTTRSVEIPACGGFMLAERTAEHLNLFREGAEAEFFGTNEELLQKCRYYLANTEQRKIVAGAGRERCLQSGYSYHDQIPSVLNRLRELTTNDNYTTWCV